MISEDRGGIATIVKGTYTSYKQHKLKVLTNKRKLCYQNIKFPKHFTIKAANQAT